MRFLRTLVVVATTTLAIASPHTADASPTVAASTFTASVERLVFQVSLDSFTSARLARTPSWHDWSTDGCSTPGAVGLGDTGRSFNFRHACWRHDFAYRNTKLADSMYGPPGTYWNSTTRLRIDNRLLSDMQADCAWRSWTERYTCLGWAQTYYRAVRLFGGP